MLTSIKSNCSSDVVYTILSNTVILAPLPPHERQSIRPKNTTLFGLLTLIKLNPRCSVQEPSGKFIAYATPFFTCIFLLLAPATCRLIPFIDIGFVGSLTLTTLKPSLSSVQVNPKYATPSNTSTQARSTKPKYLLLKTVGLLALLTSIILKVLDQYGAY